jgi:hypothetical protein
MVEQKENQPITRMIRRTIFQVDYFRSLPPCLAKSELQAIMGVLTLALLWYFLIIDEFSAMRA